MSGKKKKILLTGAMGIVGTIAQKELKKYFITLVDLPEVDIRHYNSLLKLSSGNDIIMHFAWDSKSESAYLNDISTNNILMAYNIYRVAAEAKIPRVIMASSLHADDYELRAHDELLSPYRLPTPRSLYGVTKIYIEALGRYYARQGLSVICVRFGRVTPDNTPDSLDSSARFLTHQDFGQFLECCIEAKNIPNNYAIVYAVSNSNNRIHDIKNPLGWVPKDNAADRFRGHV